MKRRLVTVIRPASSSETDSLAVIRSVSEEGFRTGWKAGRKLSTNATIARDRAALMNIVFENTNNTFPDQKENKD